ncbi:hypothetical protein ACFVVM_32475 [Nocardia sp. NPDC058176]|uniref:hypothetical protein n=1 Tax=Nocardia sp. NPDC058176 TaxID=3346368 RepID=UPI0036DADFF7
MSDQPSVSLGLPIAPVPTPPERPKRSRGSARAAKGDGEAGWREAVDPRAVAIGSTDRVTETWEGNIDAWFEPEPAAASTDSGDSGSQVKPENGSIKRPRKVSTTGGRRKVDRLSILLLVGVVFGVCMVVWVSSTSGSTQQARTDATPSATSPISEASSTSTPVLAASPQLIIPRCKHVRTAELVSGTGVGGTESAVGAILGFEHAFYERRSGAAAHAFVVEGAQVPPAEDLQGLINEIPAQTRYCVRITPTEDPNLHRVRLQEQWPGQPVDDLFEQLITTRTVDGITKITAITEVPAK